MQASRELQSLQRSLDNGTIPPNEPMFCLRASDRFAAALVRLWVGMAIAAETPIWMTDNALALADEMERWPIRRTPGRPDTQIDNSPAFTGEENVSQSGASTNRRQARRRRSATR